MIRGLFIFFLASLFYLYDFVLQVAPSVMSKQMMQAFHITAGGFGVISSFYFYSYAPMQIPSGILYDRYGARRIMTGAVLICALGSLFFSLTENVYMAALGRFMIGFGAAFSFVGVLILISRWFPVRYFALLAGITQSMSSLGAIFGEAPLALLIQHTSWRQASIFLSIIGFALSVFFWIFIRDYPHKQTQSAPKTHIFYEWRRLHAVCRHRYTWLIGSYSFTIWAPIVIFAALWGIPYLQAKYPIGVVQASIMISLVWVGIGVGSPLMGWLSDYLHTRKYILALAAAIGLTASLFVFHIPDLSIKWMYPCLFLLGLGSSGQIISFAVVQDCNPAHLVGTASGINNMCILLGGAIFQPLVGYFLHQSRYYVVVDHASVYGLEAYYYALLIIPICYFLSLMIALFLIKESYKAKKIKKSSIKKNK